MNPPAPTRLGYGFVPLPHAVAAALREQALSHSDLAILVALYSAAKVPELRARLTLEQIAERAAWPHTSNYLSKRLRAMKEAGWLAFESRPGHKAHRYDIVLRPRSSDSSPSTSGASRPSTEGRPFGSNRRQPGDASRESSEQRNDQASEQRPSSDVSSPSTRAAKTTPVPGTSAATRDELVPPPQTDVDKSKAVIEEAIGKPASPPTVTDRDEERAPPQEQAARIPANLEPLLRRARDGYGPVGEAK